MSTNLEKSKRPFGYELLLDLYDCKEGVCDNLGLARKFLINVVREIGMTTLAEPVVVRADEKKYPDLVGYSGWIPLIESSIVIHAISSTRFISINVYSCKEFNPEKAIIFCKKYFSPKSLDKKFLERGIHYLK